MEAIAKSFIIQISTITASLSYCYLISSRIPKGIYRFISLIPILYIFTILPLNCSFVLPTAITFSFTTWLTNFKLIRFAFDLDHSPFNPSDSLVRFIIFTALPINSETMHPDHLIKSSPRIYQLKLWIQIVVLSVFIKIVLGYHDQVHQKLISFIYGWVLFLLIDIVTAITNMILFLTIGLELEPSSYHPYLATSLQNFWGRWNLLVTNTLRLTVYKPIVVTLPHRKWAPLVGILASFLVSGLMHELFVYQLSRAAPTWEMTLFFMLHGICVVVEMVVKRVVGGGRWRLPGFVGWLMTMVFVVVTGVWLFVPPFVKGRVDVKMLHEYKYVVNSIKSKYSQIYV
ncbi:hypothetical protein R6Q59_009619 [Mikania micrantha]